MCSASKAALLALLLAFALASPRAARAERFEDLGPALGLPIGALGATAPRTLVAGVTATDLDGDSAIDLVVTDPYRGLTVYLRDGATFRAAPEWTDGAVGIGYGHTLFDMDGDGDLDLFYALDGGDRLFENVGDKLVDATASRLPSLPGWTFTATAADLDGDRDLDLVVARYIERTEFPMHLCHHNLVLENDGTGHFRDVTALTGLAGTRGCSFVTLAFDLDDDLDLDLVTINDFTQFTGATELWLDEGRDDATGLPLWREVARERGLVAPVYGMGMAIADLDQNGRLDFFITNIGETLLFELDPSGRFVDAGPARGLDLRFAADRNLATWTARALDLDRDGRLDLLVAAGSLPAADFIGNGPEMQSPWLRADAAGRLVAQPPGEAFAVPQSSMRDFAFADIDGDERPEIIAVHIHGGISILRDTTLPPPPTILELVPSATAPGAAGAVVTLGCEGAAQTRHVIAGGDYGNADLGRVEITLPPPCDRAGLTLTGQVRWPSGYLQALAVDSARSTRVMEPAWLVASPTALTIDLGAHLAPPETVTPVGHGVELGARETLGAHHWRWPLTLTAAQARLTLLADDEHPLGAQVRLERPDPDQEVELWIDPPTPIVGRPLSVYLRQPTPDPLASVHIGDSAPAPLSPLSDDVHHATLTPTVTGPAELVLTRSTGETSFALEVAGAASPTRSELVVRDLHIDHTETSFQVARLRVRPVDANGRVSTLPLEAIGLLVDGLPARDVGRANESTMIALSIPHAVLHDGARLEVTVDDEPWFGPRYVAHLAPHRPLASVVSVERSRCAVSEARLVADGHDRGSLLIQLFDAEGVRMRTYGVRPVVEAQGVTVLRMALVESAGGWLVPVRAGEVAGVGTISLRLPGQIDPITCTVPLVERASPRRALSGGLLVTSPGDPHLDQAVVIRFVPHGPDGRGLGSDVRFRLVVEGAETEPITAESADLYNGLARYDLIVTPRLEGPLVVRAIAEDERVVAERTFAVFRDDGGEPGPEATAEPTPEEVDESEPTEEAELIEIAEPPVEEVELDDGPGEELGAAEPEPVEPMPEPFEPEPVEPEPTEAESVELEPGPEAEEPEPEPEPAAESHAADALETSEPDPRAPADDGCRAAPNPLWAALLALLVVLARRHRDRA